MIVLRLFFLYLNFFSFYTSINILCIQIILLPLSYDDLDVIFFQIGLCNFGYGRGIAIALNLTLSIIHFFFKIR